ncbi:hypothetical protein PSPO01_16535 [Paraphaeosphaeria sporulosa]
MHASRIREVSLKHSYAWRYGDEIYWRDFYQKLLAMELPFPVLERFYVDMKDQNENFGVEINDFVDGFDEDEAFTEVQLVNASKDDKTGEIKIAGASVVALAAMKSIRGT